MRIKVRNALLATGVVIGIATGIIYVQKPNTPIIPPPPPGTANVFLAPPSTAGLGTSGNDADATNCKRFAPGVAAPPGGTGFGCATWNKAYTVAANGDTVYLNWTGTWTSAQQQIGPSGTKTGSSCTYANTTSCVHFVSKPGFSPIFRPSFAGVCSQLGPCGGTLKICSSYIWFDTVTWGSNYASDAQVAQISDYGPGVGAGDNSCGTTPPHDVLFSNNDWGGPFGIVGGSYNINIIGGISHNIWNFGNQMGGGGNNGTIPVVHDNIVSGVTFVNIQGNNTPGHHMECWHMDGGGNNMLVQNNTFIGCPGPYSLRVEAEGGGIGGDNWSNNVFQNNVWEGNVLNFDCHDNGCTIANNIVRFNTFNGTALNLAQDCLIVGTNTCNITGNTWYGNINAGCPPVAQRWTDGGYNINQGSQSNACTASTSLYNTTISRVSPGAPNYNNRLAGSVGPADNFVPPSTCSGDTVDADGIARPQNTNCDAGAYERQLPITSGANLWIDPNGGSCTFSSTPVAYNDAAACGSMPAAYSAVPNGTAATVFVKTGTYVGAQTFSGSRTGGMVTFQPEVASSVTWTTGSPPTGALEINLASSDYVTLYGFVINGAVFGQGSTSDPSTNVVIQNNNINVGQKTNTQDMSLGVTNNWTIASNIIGPNCCGTAGGGQSVEGIRVGKFNSLTPASCSNQTCNLTISNNLIQYIGNTCANWPTSGFGTCPDVTCTTTATCHNDGIHVFGMDTGTITGNRLYGVQCQGIFFENTNSSLQRNITITNNAVSQLTGGCLNKGIFIKTCTTLCIGGGLTGTFSGNWTIAFNTGNSNMMGPEDCTSCSSLSFNITGNYMQLFNTDDNFGTIACTAWPSTTWNYNVWTAGSPSSSAACSSTDTNGGTYSVVNDVLPPSTGIDLSLTGPVGAADNYVPPATCTPITTVDFLLTSRPQNTNCDAGADERLLP